MKLWPGTPYPLGAVADETETNFSIFPELPNALNSVFLMSREKKAV